MWLEAHQSWHVDSFFGPHSTGNAHRVEVYPDQWPKKPLEHDGAIAVELKSCSSEKAAVAGRFSINGRRIQRCGSGTVAAAYLLLHELGLPKVTLKTTCEHLKLIQDQGLFGYVTQSLPLSSANPAPLKNACAGQPGFGFSTPLPMACYTAGHEQDYIIAVLEDEAQVAQFQPDLNALKRDCARALIITAPSCSPVYDFVLRYFAPQYGVPEDSATGSANAVLAPYWAHRLGRNELRSRQVSAQGGEFYLSVLTRHPPSNLQEPVSVSVLGRATHR